jgi:hypothetical protein
MDPVVVEVPIEFEASKDRRESAAHMNDQHLELRVAIEHAGADHPGAVTGGLRTPPEIASIGNLENMPSASLTCGENNGQEDTR